MKRFIVKKVTVVWRNSMIAGNPVTRRFQKFGVYDRNWADDHYCCCPRPGGDFVSQANYHKYRLVVDDNDMAQKVADRMNELLEARQPVKRIKFKFPFISFCKESDIPKITVAITEA